MIKYLIPVAPLAIYVAVSIFVMVHSVFAEGKDNLLLNGDAEQGKGDLPSAWTAAQVKADGLKFKWTSQTACSGKASLMISNTHQYEKKVCNNWCQRVFNVPAGKTVQLSAYVRTENVDSVNLCVQCWSNDGDKPMLAFASTPILRGSQSWTRIMCKPIEVPVGTSSIMVRAVLTGTGKVWFDDLSLTVLP